jgi:4-amino-4-deoxy-L-arabinose transferase-like glycosyltransferase
MWAAFVLGGMLVTLAIALLPFVFPHFADAVSISQARRIIGFSPRAFALVGGALVLAGFLRWALLPVALAAGIVLQHYFPGDFGRPYRPEHGAPAGLTWVAFGAAIAALVAAAFFGRRIPQVEGRGLVAAAAVALFVTPVAVHGYSHWSRPPSARQGLPQKLVAAVREHVPKGDIVFSDPLTAYELGAFAPVYVNAAPQSHVAATRANHPTRRVHDAQRFFRDGGPLSVPRRYGAHWLLVDKTRVLHKRFALPRVYSGARYVLYHLR